MRERERGRKRVDDVDVNATRVAFGAKSLATCWFCWPKNALENGRCCKCKILSTESFRQIQLKKHNLLSKSTVICIRTRCQVNSIYLIARKYILRIFSSQITEIYWRGTRELSPKSVRREFARHIHTYIHQCNMPSIERQYEAAYLSFLLLLSRAHFYERIHQPDYRWSLRIAFTVFSFVLSILAYGLFISVVLILSFFPLQQTRFSQMQKIVRREMFDSGQSQRACDGFKYFHTRCIFSYSWQTLVTRLLLDDVEPSFPMAITIK